MIAALALTNLVGCTDKPGKLLSGTDLGIPELDSKVKEPCNVPPVARNAKIAALQQRNALFECREKHKIVVDQYDRVRVTYSGKPHREHR